MITSALATSLVGTTLYVSPQGRDAHSGRRARPVASLQRAVELARSAPKPVRIVVKGGEYELSAPITLGASDSGLLIEAARGERPVFLGSRRVSGLQVDGRGWWRVTVPPELRRSVQLWVNGARRYRTRLPEKGVFRIARFIDRAPDAPAGYDRFGFHTGDLQPHWHDRGNIDLMAVHQWLVSRNRIAELTQNEVRLARRTGYNDYWAQYRAGSAYWVENVREALGVAGRWYLDRNEGELIYVPRAEERADRAELRLPLLNQLLVLRGEAAAPIQDVTVRGLTFRHTSWELGAGTRPAPAWDAVGQQPEAGLGRFFPQAEADLRGAITADHARNLKLERLTVEGTGEYAVDFGENVQDSSLVESTLQDLGAGGVKLGLMQNEPNDNLRTSGNRIEGCRILHGGRLHAAGIGVWIGQSPHNVVSRNLIADFYYSGISAGWSWGYDPSDCHHNTISFNRIAHIGQGLLSDMGGVYTLGISEGTVLKGNVIHDVQSSAYGGWGLYTDEGSTGILLEDNVVYRTNSAGFHQHYGRDNVIRNNIFAFGGEAQLMRNREESHRSFTFKHNIVFWENAPLLSMNWHRGDVVLDRNLYWRTDGKPVDFLGETLEAWRARGYDQNSLIADPLFRDPARGDFRLRPGSPAKRIGYVKPDLSQVPKRVPPLAESAFPTGLKSPNPHQ